MNKAVGPVSFPIMDDVKESEIEMYKKPFSMKLQHLIDQVHFSLGSSWKSSRLIVNYNSHITCHLGSFEVGFQSLFHCGKYFEGKWKKTANGMALYIIRFFLLIFKCQFIISHMFWYYPYLFSLGAFDFVYIFQTSFIWTQLMFQFRISVKFLTAFNISLHILFYCDFAIL